MKRYAIVCALPGSMMTSARLKLIPVDSSRVQSVVVHVADHHRCGYQRFDGAHSAVQGGVDCYANHRDPGVVALAGLQRLRSIRWQWCPLVTFAAIETILSRCPHLHCYLSWGPVTLQACQSHLEQSPHSHIDLLSTADAPRGM